MWSGRRCIPGLQVPHGCLSVVGRLKYPLDSHSAAGGGAKRGRRRRRLANSQAHLRLMKEKNLADKAKGKKNAC